MGALRRISRTAKLRSQRAAESNDTVPPVKVGENTSSRGTLSPDHAQIAQDRDKPETTESRF